MIIVDTSIWVDHFRRTDAKLVTLLADNAATLHPFVYGELLLGGLPTGDAADALKTIPQAPVGTAEEAVTMIIRSRLAGTGIGYVDSHLLVSARLLARGQLFTRDKRLHAQAEGLGVAFLG